MRHACFYLIASVAVVLWGGCNAYDSDLIEGPAGTPARPKSSTSSSEDDQVAVFALNGISLQQFDGRAERIGVNLDGFVTNSTSAPHECVAEGGVPVLDGDRGIDNSFGRNVLPALTAAAPCLEDDIAISHALGQGTILVRIRDWNGRRDDAQVDIGLFVTVDGTSLDESEEVRWGGLNGTTLLRASNFASAPPPAWDGGDRFFVDPVGLADEGNLERPRIGQNDAYIASGRLVLENTAATIFPVVTRTGSFPIGVDGFFMADISEDQQSLTKGFLSGRFAAERIVGSLQSLGFCSQENVDVLGSILTRSLDLRADPDIQEPDNACSAMSLGLSFRGTRVSSNLGIAPRSLPISNPCEGGEDASTLYACCATTAINDPDTYAAVCEPDDRVEYEQLPLPIPVPPAEGF